jgi:hypothetical protein
VGHSRPGTTTKQGIHRLVSTIPSRRIHQRGSRPEKSTALLRFVAIVGLLLLFVLSAETLMTVPLALGLIVFWLVGALRDKRMMPAAPVQHWVEIARQGVVAGPYVGLVGWSLAWVTGLVNIVTFWIGLIEIFPVVVVLQLAILRVLPGPNTARAMVRPLVASLVGAIAALTLGTLIRTLAL